MPVGYPVYIRADKNSIWFVVLNAINDVFGIQSDFVYRAL